MTRQPIRFRHLAGLSAAVLLAHFTPAAAQTAAPAPPPRPNIIYILADDMGIGDLGCYGQKMVTTPHLDHMAAEGMRFTRHYAGSTVCAPSRCVLMTGLHTGHCRVRGNDPWIIPDADPTVPNVLRQAGYHTACMGKYGLGKPLPLNDPARKGFDEFFGYVGTSHAHNFYAEALVKNGALFPLENKTIPGSGKDTADYADSAFTGTGVATADGRKQWAPQLIAAEVQRYLTARATRHPAQPFFIYYALNLPHTNNEARQDSPLGHGMECPDYGEFASRDWPAAEKGFARFIRFVDDEVGRILTRLRALGIAEQTLVLFSSDNGPHQEGGHKSDFFDSNGPHRGIKRELTDGGIRVPFIAWWPGKVRAASVSDHVSGFQDLLPTAAELSGAAAAFPTDGVSLVPALLGQPNQKQHSHLFWDFNEQGGKRAVLQWPWKLIHRNTGNVSTQAKAKGPGGKNAKRAPLIKELYNLESDIAEEHNLAAKHPDRVAALEKLMAESWRAPEKSTP